MTSAVADTPEPVEDVVARLRAVRHIQLRWWQQLLTVTGLTAMGALVVSIKIVAH